MVPKMKKSKKVESSMSPLTLALIITGSIVAAAGIVLLILKLVKKKPAKACACDCCDELDDIDSWELDEEFLASLGLEDDEVEVETVDAPVEAVEEVVEAAAEEDAQ